MACHLIANYKLNGLTMTWGLKFMILKKLTMVFVPTGHYLVLQHI